jgi:hypothetical protein
MSHPKPANSFAGGWFTERKQIMRILLFWETAGSWMKNGGFRCNHLLFALRIWMTKTMSAASIREAWPTRWPLAFMRSSSSESFCLQMFEIQTTLSQPFRNLIDNSNGTVRIRFGQGYALRCAGSNCRTFPGYSPWASSKHHDSLLSPYRHALKGSSVSCRIPSRLLLRPSDRHNNVSYNKTSLLCAECLSSMEEDKTEIRVGIPFLLLYMVQVSGIDFLVDCKSRVSRSSRKTKG